MDVNQIEELVFKIVAAAMTVHNAIGHGLREKTYERALVVEFQHLGISYDQQHRYPVLYRDVKVDEYIPDLEVEDLIVVERSSQRSMMMTSAKSSTTSKSQAKALVSS
jgi:GxxExxY protein